MYYRKYRPKKFNEIVGQEIIVKILKNFLKNRQSLPQGYLFAGQRGTGKTSTARIFAKALNCLNLEKNDYEPCDECINCKTINSGQFLDLIELDAASNRGIDEIRNLKEHIGFKPIQGKYKVFIIDEAHMLTEPAFNALLKTLEEPPSHVIFILATTEPDKIPATILSRVQRFDFKRVSLKDIVKKLKYIAEKEGIQTTESALYLIAEEAGGSLRDAETLFEKIVLSLNPHKMINEEYVEEFLGKISNKEILNFLELFYQKNFEAAIKKIHQAYEEGYDLIVFTKSVIKILRDILILKILPKWENQLLKTYPEEVVSKIINLSKNISLEDIKKGIKLFTDAESGIKRDPPFLTLPLEIAVAEYCLS
jgi:DNA polymerase-3 subunit gamma/tau